MSDIVRLQTRLPEATHSKLVEYAKEQNLSMNNAMIQLLDFALSYAKIGENKILDESLDGFKNNLLKVKYIVDGFLVDDVLEEYARSNDKQYLEYISERFTHLSFEDKKLLSNIAHSLADK
ncbi:hypothetical protein [Acinetobacter ursingii]|uniref:hypothetical protein n=1 Tax=Acinetobacter ursingii TaxID=108980 RepID=UPI00313C8AA7